MKKIIKLIPLFSLFLVSCGGNNEVDKDKNEDGLPTVTVDTTDNAKFSKLASEGAGATYSNLIKGLTFKSSVEDFVLKVNFGLDDDSSLNLKDISCDITYDIRNLNQGVDKWGIGLKVENLSATVEVETNGDSGVVEAPTTGGKIAGIDLGFYFVNDTVYFDFGDAELVQAVKSLVLSEYDGDQTAAADALAFVDKVFTKVYFPHVLEYIGFVFGDLISDSLGLTDENRINSENIVEKLATVKLAEDLTANELKKVEEFFLNLPLEIASSLFSQAKNLYSFYTKSNGEFGFDLSQTAYVALMPSKETILLLLSGIPTIDTSLIELVDIDLCVLNGGIDFVNKFDFNSDKLLSKVTLEYLADLSLTCVFSIFGMPSVFHLETEFYFKPSFEITYTTDAIAMPSVDSFNDGTLTLVRIIEDFIKDTSGEGQPE